MCKNFAGMDADGRNKINLRLLLLKTQVTKTYLTCQKLEDNLAELKKENMVQLHQEILAIDTCLNNLKSTLSVELDEHCLDLEQLMHNS